MNETTVTLKDEIVALLSASGIDNAADEAASIVAAARRDGEDGAAERARLMAEHRRSGTPLPYVTGQATFMGLDVFIAAGALIPRAETELLARTAIDLLDREHASAARVIDMCCGSGNLTSAIAALRPQSRVWASDLTDGAMAVAHRNVQQLNLADRVVLAQGDLFAPLAGLGLEGSIDLVACNPPYISSGKLAKESADLLTHEPREAFDGGPYGVSMFQRVIRDAAAFLKPGGHLAFEIGAGQERQVTLLFGRVGAYEPVTQVVDADGVPRVIVGRKRR